MAATEEGTQLTEAHRLQQLALRAVLLREVVDLWRGFDAAAIEETWSPIEAGLLALIGQGRTLSGLLAADYYEAFRAAERVAGETPARAEALRVLNDQTWREAATVSLAVTGPVRARQLTAAARPDVAAQTLVEVTGAVGRQALNGGRAVLLEYTRRDARALGWARVTSGTPCFFCAMVASRGPVYKSRGTAGFRAHDHCACSVEPVYSRSQAWPGNSRQYQALWNESTRGSQGKDSVRAFRKAFEAGAAPGKQAA